MNNPSDFLEPTHTLSGMPNELITHICSYLDRRDLNAFVLVSRQLFKISQAALYKNIDLRECGYQIPLLLRTLLIRPELAFHIQHIQLSNHSSKASRPLVGELGDCQAARLRRLTQKVKGLMEDSVEDQELLDDLPRGFPQGRVEVCLALVVSMCANLRSLHVIFGCDYYTHPSVEMPDTSTTFQFILGLSLAILNSKQLHSATSATETSSFRFFHTVKLDVDDCCRYCETWLTMYQGLDLLYLPRVRSLTLNTMLMEPKFTWPGKRPCSPQLTHLTLTKSDITPLELGEILKSCPNLTYLKYHFQIEEDTPVDYFDCNDFRAALSHVSNVLEHLILEVKTYDGKMRDEGLRDTTLDLSQFPRLQNVEVPVAVLFGVQLPDTTEEFTDVLPASLRKLALSDWFHDGIRNDWKPEITAKYLARYIIYKSTQQQQLEEIGIVLHKKYETFDDGCYDECRTWWPCEVVRDLKDVCERFHVKWDIDVGRYWNPEWAKEKQPPVPVFAVSLQGP